MSISEAVLLEQLLNLFNRRRRGNRWNIHSDAVSRLFLVRKHNGGGFPSFGVVFFGGHPVLPLHLKGGHHVFPPQTCSGLADHLLGPLPGVIPEGLDDLIHHLHRCAT